MHIDYLIIIAASIITVINPTAANKIILISWLLLSDIIHTFAFVDFRVDSNWIIYYLYSAINILTIALLIKIKSSATPVLLLLINTLLNLTAGLWFISATQNEIVYNSYSYIATSIAILMLVYMSLNNELRERTNLHKCINSDSDNGDGGGRWLRRGSNT